MKSVFRVVKTSLWQDEKVLKFSPEDKYFWMYLLTNPHSSQLGIYYLPIEIAAVELGYSADSVMKLIRRFDEYHKFIKYSEETNEIAIKNFLRYSIISGGKPVMDCLIRDMKNVKDRSLLKYVFSSVSSKPIENETVKSFMVYMGKNIEMIPLDESQEKESTKEKELNKNENDDDNDNIIIVDESYHESSDESSDESYNESDNESSHDSSDKSSSTSSSIENLVSVENTAVPIPSPMRIMQMYNETCPSLPKLCELNDERLVLIKNIVNKYSLSDIQRVFSKAEASDFFKGKGKDNWVADFDWIMEEEHFIKIHSGCYDNWKKSSKNPNGIHNFQQRTDIDYEALKKRIYGN